MRILSLAVLVALAAAVLPTPANAATVNYGSYGTHPVVGSDDFGIPLEDLSSSQVPFLAWEDELSSGADDYTYYIHFDDGTITTDKQGEDFRIAVPTGVTGTLGAMLGATAGTYDTVVDLGGGGLAAADRIDDYLCHIEVDGKPGFSTNDWLYVDTDNNGNLDDGDLRLSTPSASLTPSVSVPTLRYVQTGNADLAAALSATEDTLPDDDACEATTFDMKYFDSDVGGDLDSGDTLVLVPSDSANGDFLSIGHVFLSTSGSRTHGAHATGSESSAVAVMETLGATDAYLVSTRGDCGTDSVQICDLYIHFGSPDLEPTGTFTSSGDLGYIQFGDIILRKAATGTSGAAASFMTRVTSEATGAGQAIRAYTPFAAQVYYIDNADGNDGFDDRDWLYVDVPSDGSGSTAFGGSNAVAAKDLSANDIRLTAYTGGTSYGAGTTVKTADEDATSYAAATLNANSDATPWFLMHRDLDESLGLALQTLANGKYRDHSPADDLWDAVDEAVYVSSDGKVTQGDIRIFNGDSTETSSLTGALATVACGPTITSRTSATQVVLSEAATATQTGLTVDITRKVADAVTTNTDATLTSASAVFSASDVGADITGAGIPAATTIASFTSATSVELSAAATATATGVHIAVSRQVTDGETTVSGTTLTSATAAFVAGDVGSYVTATTLSGDDADCGDTIEANTAIKITGPDTTLDEDQGEWAIWSPDLWATPGHDRAIMLVDLATDLAAGDVLGTQTDEFTGFAYSASGDAFYLQWDEAADPVGASSIWKVHDVKLGSSPDFVGATDTGFIPTLHPVLAASHAFTWYDRGSDTPAGDGFYFEIGGTIDDLGVRDVRLSATTFSTGGAAGLQLTTTNTAEIGAAAGALEQAASELPIEMYYFDEGTGPAGLDPTDPIYLDMPAAFGGGALDDISTYDIRVTQAVVGGTTYAAGSFVRIGDKDLDLNGPILFDGTPGFAVYFFDEDRDGAYDSDDVPYLYYRADAGDGAITNTAVQPDLLSIRMVGPSGSSGGGGGGGGSPTSPPTDADIVEDSNDDLADSLTVTITDGDNVLTWTAEPSVEGYQIWTKSSEDALWTLLTTILDEDVTTYTDTAGTASSWYLVTTFLDNEGELTADDVNNGDVPGYTDVPEGTPATPDTTPPVTTPPVTTPPVTTPPPGDDDDNETDGGGDDTIPGPSPLLVLALLGAAAILARRRLA